VSYGRLVQQNEFKGKREVKGFLAIAPINLKSASGAI